MDAPGGRGELRALITAAVAAGIPAGLLYAVAGYAIAMPTLLAAERLETGAPVALDGLRLLWGLVGALGLGCAVALVLTPLVRLLGNAGWRTGAAVGALAFLALFLLPALVTRPAPPGVENAGSLGMRQALWLLSLLWFGAAWAAGSRVYRITGARAWAAPAAALSGALVWVLGVALFLHLTGGPRGTLPGPVPGALAHRFAVATALTNACLFAALGWLIPRTLRRYCP